MAVKKTPQKRGPKMKAIKVDNTYDAVIETLKSLIYESGFEDEDKAHLINDLRKGFVESLHTKSKMYAVEHDDKQLTLKNCFSILDNN